jgi:hypothetical protein
MVIVSTLLRSISSTAALFKNETISKLSLKALNISLCDVASLSNDPLSGLIAIFPGFCSSDFSIK